MSGGAYERTEVVTALCEAVGWIVFTCSVGGSRRTWIYCTDCYQYAGRQRTHEGHYLLIAGSLTGDLGSRGSLR